MAFPRKLLNDTEELVLDLRPHWLAIAVPPYASELRPVTRTLAVLRVLDGGLLAGSAASPG